MSKRKSLSPCIKVCELDADGRVCVGCHRTLDEIGAWGSMTHDEQVKMLAELERRRAKAA